MWVMPYLTNVTNDVSNYFVVTTEFPTYKKKINRNPILFR